jgi:microcystin-dependent protein
MAEVVHDLKLTNLELTTDIGLNFSGDNPRVKHTGTGTFTIKSSIGKIDINSGSSAENSLKLESAGGILMTTDGLPAITIESDATVGINTADPDNTYDLDVNGKTNTTSLYQAGYLLVPPGSMMPYCASSAPGGWLLCDGSAYSRSTYAVLFAIIGVTYGVGNGTTTFNVPDLRGKFVIGLNSSDTDFDSLGETGGSKNKTLSTTEIPSHTHSGTTSTDGSHTHTVTDPGHTHSVGGTLRVTGNDTVDGIDNDGPDAEPDISTTITTTSSTSTTGISIPSSGSHSHAFTTGATGGGLAFSLMNPYMALNYIIKI